MRVEAIVLPSILMLGVVATIYIAYVPAPYPEVYPDLAPPIDCALGEPVAGPCDCNTSSRTWTYPVTTEPQNGGAECGPLTFEETCVPEGCPVDCALGEPVPGPCDCSTSSRTWTYPVSTEPRNGGAECGPLTFEETCVPEGCPVDCALGEPVPGPCDCNTSSRTWTYPVSTEPQNGGAECGPLSFSEACAPEGCVPSTTRATVAASCGSYVEPSPTCFFHPRSAALPSPISALSLNGSGSYLRRNSHPYGAQYTIAAWVKCTGDPARADPYTVMCRGRYGGGSDGRQMHIANGFLVSYADGAGSNAHPTPFPFDRWTFVAVTFRARAVSYIAINDDVHAYVPCGMNAGTDTRCVIGASSGGFGQRWFFQGLVDECAYWVRDLSRAELLSLYHGGTPAPSLTSDFDCYASSDALRGHWKFDRSLADESGYGGFSSSSAAYVDDSYS